MYESFRHTHICMYRNVLDHIYKSVYTIIDFLFCSIPVFCILTKPIVCFTVSRLTIISLAPSQFRHVLERAFRPLHNTDASFAVFILGPDFSPDF